MSTTRPGRYRWVICSLLFFATSVNYLDRQVIGLLKDFLAKDLNWSEKDYSHIIMAFTAAYAIGMLAFGWFVDRIGTKKGYVGAIMLWSGAAMAHALAKTTTGFGIARTFLGLGESGNFPVAIKAVAEWFPKKERALATGIFNSGSNIAAIAGPPLIMWLYYSYGWHAAFLWTGIAGFVWLIFWLVFYEIPSRHKKLSEGEFNYIHSDDTPEQLAAESHQDANKNVSWIKLFNIRQTWAFILGKFLTDPVWWFYLFWVPSYIHTSFGLDLSKSWKHISVIYIVSSFGSVLGGYFSGWLIRRGWPVYKARKIAMLLYAACVVPIIFVRATNNAWVAVALISLAAAAHQAWSANIFTTASDMFPKKAVSSVVGIGGMAGALGGVVFPFFIGWVLDSYKTAGNMNAGYNIIFIVCGMTYLLGWLMMHLLAPKMKQVQL